MASNAVRRSAACCFAALIVSSQLHSQSLASEARAETSAYKLGSVSIDVTNVPLVDVLKSISMQAGLNPAYGNAVTQSSARVTAHLKDVSAVDAFEHALRGTGLTAIFSGRGVSFVRGVDRAWVIEGGITGTVVDAKTKLPLRGVTLVLDGSTKGATSGNDGRFRFDNVASGAHTIKVRLMGYVKATKTVDVQDGQAASITIALEQSTNELDQVVVTGSVIPTERRAIANAMTVITAKDIEARGITRLDQLFRGDVPGLFAPDLGNNNALDSVRLFSRGATNIGMGSGVGGNISFDANAVTSPVKTYLDGIELASPELISQIDPTSIERVEVVTGPQAATIYGANATNGVIQIFTKRGTTATPKWRFNANTGFIQNSSRVSLAPSNDLSAAVSGMEGRVSYSGGGRINTTGPWVPNKNTTRYNGNLGANIEYTALSLNFSARQSLTTNLSRGGSSRGIAQACEQGLVVIGGNFNNICRNGLNRPGFPGDSLM